MLRKYYPRASEATLSECYRSVSVPFNLSPILFCLLYCWLYSLIVDVKLSAIKTAKISIWRGDDPYTLASSFARIYSLDGKARDLLVTVIRNSMEQNGLIVTPDPLMDTPHAAPDGFQHSGAFDYTGEGGAGQAGRQSGDDVYEGLEMLSAEDEYYSESSVSGSVIEGDDGQSTISDEDSVGSATEQSEPESENLTA